MNENENENPLFVKIPETGEQINVRPLINFIRADAFFTTQEGAINQAKIIADVIEIINTRFIFDSEDIEDNTIQKGLFESLYALKKLFNNFTVVKY